MIVLPSQLVAITLQSTTVLYTYDTTSLTLTASTTAIPQLPIPATYPYTVGAVFCCRPFLKALHELPYSIEQHPGCLLAVMHHQV